MDIHRLTYRAFRKNVFGAFLISALIITIASMLGRGLLNMQASLTLPEPTELTIALLVEPYDLFPREVLALPRRNGEWRYSITVSNGDIYFVRVSPDGPPWHLTAKPERLRGSIRESL